jgi:hypothetical protein
MAVQVGDVKGERAHSARQRQRQRYFLCARGRNGLAEKPQRYCESPIARCLWVDANSTNVSSRTTRLGLLRAPDMEYTILE